MTANNRRMKNRIKKKASEQERKNAKDKLKKLKGTDKMNSQYFLHC
jgi:hypothetical protein